MPISKQEFQSNLIESVLLSFFRKGEADFKSDNIMTLCVLKEALSVEATKKKAKIEINLRKKAKI